MTKPAEIFYVVPVGSVIAWYPPAADTPLPPCFALCDGSVVSDVDSPYHGRQTPNLTNRLPLGAGGPVGLNEQGGDVNYTLMGLNTGPIETSPTEVFSSDNIQNNIIQGNNPTSSWRYVLTDDASEYWNDGNHHHMIPDMFIPAPAWVGLYFIMRIK